MRSAVLRRDLDGLRQQLVAAAIAGGHRRQQTAETNVGQAARARREHRQHALAAGRAHRRCRRRRQSGHPGRCLELLRQHRRFALHLGRVDVADDDQRRLAQVVDPSQPRIDVGARDPIQLAGVDDARVAMVAEQRAPERPLGFLRDRILDRRHTRQPPLQLVARRPVGDRRGRLGEEHGQCLGQLRGQELDRVEREIARGAARRQDVQRRRPPGFRPRAQRQLDEQRRIGVGISAAEAEPGDARGTRAASGHHGQPGRQLRDRDRRWRAAAARRAGSKSRPPRPG